MSKSVLDASALLAYLNEEPGAAVVEQALIDKAIIGTANWAEVLSKVAEVGVAPRDLAAELEQRGLLGQSLKIEPLLPEDSLRIAELRPRTRSHGLSLGDRACLALGIRLGLPVITTDRAWEMVDLDIEVHVIR